MSHPWIIDRTSSTSEVLATLRDHGVAIIPDALSRHDYLDLATELTPHFERTDFSKGLFYGTQTKRFGRVLCRSVTAQRLALHPLSFEVAKDLLGNDCQEIQLNLTQAIEIWPGSFAQVPHRDQDIWLGARHAGELMLNAMWAIDDFTAKNGATLLWPGSHLTPELIAPDRPGVPAEMSRGSLCLFLGSTLHAGGANWSKRRRRGLVMSYCQGWLKPCENPWLSYPPSVARHFSPQLSRLVGYRQDAPSLNNVEGQCPSLLLSGGLELSFADHLTAEQTALIEQYNASQLEGAKAASAEDQRVSISARSCSTAVCRWAAARFT